MSQTPQDKPTERLEFDPEACSKMYQELVEIFKKYKPTVGEILIAYGNLGYTLGASIGQWPNPGPSVQELEKIYYSDQARLDAAMMLMGHQVTEWYNDYQKLVIDKKGNT